MKFKYIHLEKTGIIMWPDSGYVYHRDVAKACQGQITQRVVSAGFADIENGTVKCYGKSFSLNIGSQPNADSARMAMMLGLKVAE